MKQILYIFGMICTFSWLVISFKDGNYLVGISQFLWFLIFLIHFIFIDDHEKRGKK
jgi:hypothetical protein